MVVNDSKKMNKKIELLAVTVLAILYGVLTKVLICSWKEKDTIEIR